MPLSVQHGDAATPPARVAKIHKAAFDGGKILSSRSSLFQTKRSFFSREFKESSRMQGFVDGSVIGLALLGCRLFPVVVAGFR
jgi:hypothetical protein